MRRNQDSNWNDFLFKDRNKAYGAYEIRTNENWNLLKATFIGLFIMGIFLAVFSFTDKSVEEPTKQLPTPTIHNPVSIIDKVKPTQKFVKPKVIPVAKKVEKETKAIPDPKDQPEKETKVADNSNLHTIESDDSDAGESDGNTGSYVGQGSIGDDNGTVVATPTPTAPVVNNTIYNVRDVAKVAVFPGCESAGNNEKELLRCMSASLQKQLGDQLEDFNAIAQRYNVNLAKTRLQFVVDKNGRITQIKAAKGNSPEFDREAKAALDRIAKRMANRKQFLQAAELDDGSKVNMNFSLPIQYLFE